MTQATSESAIILTRPPGQGSNSGRTVMVANEKDAELYQMRHGEHHETKVSFEETEPRSGKWYITSRER